MIHHVTLETRPADCDACAAFFALLGFEEREPPEGLRGVARWLVRGDEHVHLLFADEPVVSPGGHVGLVPDDLEATVAALNAAGHPTEDRTRHWGARRAFATDPAGHVVELMEYPPGPPRPIRSPAAARPAGTAPRTGTRRT